MKESISDAEQHSSVPMVPSPKHLSWSSTQLDRTCGICFRTRRNKVMLWTEEDEKIKGTLKKKRQHLQSVLKSAMKHAAAIQYVSFISSVSSTSEPWCICSSDSALTFSLLFITLSSWSTSAMRSLVGCFLTSLVSQLQLFGCQAFETGLIFSRVFYFISTDGMPWKTENIKVLYLFEIRAKKKEDQKMARILHSSAPESVSSKIIQTKEVHFLQSSPAIIYAQNIS